MFWWNVAKRVLDRYEWVMARTIEAGNGCLEFQGQRDRNGYGVVSVWNEQKQKSLRKYATRIVLQKSFGPLRRDQLACHKCDNPPCVNPDHLFVGSHQDNMDDAVSKGRMSRTMGRRGIKNVNAKLNEQQVNEIRELFGSMSDRIIANKYGVGRTTVVEIRAGRSWSWLKGK